MRPPTWEHAVAGTAGLVHRPVLLQCSSEGCNELVRIRSRFCVVHHHPKYEERSHVLGAEEHPYQPPSNLYSLIPRNRRAAKNLRGQFTI